jgi:hypothetical protein
MGNQRSFDPDPSSTRLAGDITVGQYTDMVQRQDRQAISELIRLRFEERYLEPVLDNPKRHGFSMLAVCCLMVEALESFRQGWKDTSERGKSEGAFCSFFDIHDEFKELQPLAHDFYRAVRCGILHQAETTRGWRVDRKPGLTDERNGVRWVSAFEFGTRLRTVLNSYCDDLSMADWTGPQWVNARKKLQAICRNCGLNDVEKLK